MTEHFKCAGYLSCSSARLPNHNIAEFLYDLKRDESALLLHRVGHKPCSYCLFSYVLIKKGI